MPYTRAYSIILGMYPFFFMANTFLPLARLFFSGVTFLFLARLFFFWRDFFFSGATFSSVSTSCIPYYSVFRTSTPSYSLSFPAFLLMFPHVFPYIFLCILLHSPIYSCVFPCVPLYSALFSCFPDVDLEVKRQSLIPFHI